MDEEKAYHKQGDKIIPGIYRHYKNGKEYQVLFTAPSTETGEEMVVYKALYGDNETWIRPAKIFSAKVKHNKTGVRRFVLIKESKPEDTFEDKYKRALADYQNLLKRTAMEKEEFIKFANEELIREILPVYDNLKMSLLHADEQAEKNGWLEGVKHVVRQFHDILSTLGVEEIKTAGKKFDHYTMEAIGGRGDKVKQEVRPGYKLRGKVIVSAKVILNN